MTKQTQPRTITRVVYQLEKLVPGSFAHTELTSLSAPVEDYNPEKGLKSSFSARTRPTLYRMLLVSGLGSTSPRPLDRYLTQDEESEKLKAILSRYTFKNLLDSCLDEELWTNTKIKQERIFGALQTVITSKHLNATIGNCSTYNEATEKLHLFQLAELGMILKPIEIKQRKPVNA